MTPRILVPPHTIYFYRDTEGSSVKELNMNNHEREPSANTSSGSFKKNIEYERGVGMREVQIEPGITLFVTAHSWEQLKENKVDDPAVVERHLVEDTFHDFLDKEGTFRKQLEEFSKETGFDGIAILVAHGDHKNKVWVYLDHGNETKSVEDWVRENDGKYAALFLFVCNGESTRIRPAKHSLLVVPEGDIHYDRSEIVTDNGDRYRFYIEDDKVRWDRFQRDGQVYHSAYGELVPPEVLQNYKGPFYENYPEFLVIEPEKPR